MCTFLYLCGSYFSGVPICVKNVRINRRKSRVNVALYKKYIFCVGGGRKGLKKKKKIKKGLFRKYSGQYP